MSKEIYISSTPHETRLAIVEKDELSEIYYERENEYTLAGSIYNGRVTRVLPGMQSAFVDVGLERDAFLYITDFLEEQGESADFEGGEPRRGGAERGGDRERGGRGREPSREQGREQAREVNREQPNESARLSEPVSTPQRTEAVAERGPEAGDEGADDGSRTWRGRRGRRRGRSGEHRGAGTAGEGQTGADALPAQGASEAESEPLDQLHGQAQGEAIPRESRPREDRSREDRGRGGDRDRGGREREARGRDRFADRGRRAERSEAPETTTAEPGASAEPFILPGESLSKYRKGDDADIAISASYAVKSQTTQLTARPSTEVGFSVAGWDGGAVLPGETLSRRRGLPGEATSTPRTTEEAVSSGPGVQNFGFTGTGADDSGRGRDRRRERDRQRGRGGRPDRERQASSTEDRLTDQAAPTSFHSGVVSLEQLEPAEAVQPGVTSQHEPEANDLPSSEAGQDFAALAHRIGAADDAPDLEAAAFESRELIEAALAQDTEYVPETDAAPAATEYPSEAVQEAVEQLHGEVAATAAATAERVGEEPAEFHEETLEYEPGEDAAASYRVDPAGPSEFRQSSPVEDELNLAEMRFEQAHGIAQEGATHDFTAVQASGEMLSELPADATLPGAEPDLSNPVEHETAVQSVHLQQAEMVAGATVGVAGLSFAPGDGQLEEELMDDDDVDLFALSATQGDDVEEETFEAGAEIGSLVRDRALDEMTRTGSGLNSVLDDEQEEDEFDIDEEEMEEDELDGTEEIAGSDVSELESDEASEEEDAGFYEEGEKPAAAAMGEFPEFTEEGAAREPRRERGGYAEGRPETRREPRRGDRDRGGRGGRGGRDSRGMANSRSNGGRPQGRHSMQNTDLPAISDLLKPGQEVLVQIAKEPIAKKGARITSHIALPGRFLVFMPTVNHVGVSRKIESDGERRRLKEILLSEKGEAAGGFIVRTAAMGASEEELRSDLRFLLNLWADIKQRSEASKSPALIYHDLNLVERVLRDQVGDNFSAIWVDTETEYERVLRFLQRFQPSLMRRVKLYTKDTPLFEQFGIAEEINKALRSKVWLKSGGSIVINQTEALVAIDINTGKFVGKTARLEDTIVKTNLDAIPEIVRQIRLRDLGGIIVIDFIDMDDRKNRQRVLLALEEELKHDRAPSKVLQFNDFGLVAITRKRVKQSLERTLSTTCAICAGTGMTKSPVTVCNEIYIELRKMHRQLDKGDVMLRVNPEVVKQLKSGNGKWLQEMEEISGKTILIKSDPSLHPEQFDIH